MEQRFGTIDRENSLSISRQCQLVGVRRERHYHKKKGEKEQNLHLMRLIDQQFLETPFYGYRKMTAHLQRDGHAVNEKRVRRLMRKMGIVAIYRKPNTSTAHPRHPVYPYLLRGMTINKANQVWCADITYIPMERGFLYLVAVMDWFSRKVLSWRLSNSMDADFCVDALAEAIGQYSTPLIFNTDQGSQFTADAFTSLLKTHTIQISMDGKGRCMDNIFIERLWRSLKYESVYIQAYASGSHARQVIGQWVEFYNHHRPHQALGYQTPHHLYTVSINHNDTPSADLLQTTHLPAITP